MISRSNEISHLIKLDESKIDELSKFITERERVRIKKNRGDIRPWTDDLILQNYKFCNVKRSHDKTTMWIVEKWINPFQDHSRIWFAIAVARYINNVDTLNNLPHPCNRWNEGEVINILKDRQNKGLKVFTSAYVVAVSGDSSPKYESIPKFLTKLGFLQPRGLNTLAEWFDVLTMIRGVGSFMAGQIIADLKYTPYLDMYTTKDWYTWACQGPGSERGLNRVCGREINTPWGKEWFELFYDLHKIINRHIPVNLDAQDLQNCLCEFDKYERLRLGEGTVRSKYEGGVV